MSSADAPIEGVDAPPALPEDELARLEARLQRAFADGDERGLEVLGYGEISSVVAWTVGDERFACKRLPDIDDRGRLDAYRALFERYLAVLREGGVTPVGSRLQWLETDGGGFALWCVQPRLEATAVIPHVMRESLRQEAVALFEAILGRLEATVGPRVGVDAQLSNWVQVDGALRYVDVTTPLLRDAEGRDQLDTELFLASLPWALRGVVRALFVREIVDRYHELRGAVLDLLANLHKEKLEHLVAPFLDVANPRLPEAIGEDEVWRAYEDDARTWATLQRMRRLDRAWQRRVRRRPYPFLLPGAIER